MKYRRVIAENSEDSLSRLAAKVTEGSEVLDLGAGTGELGQFLSREKHCQVDGVERSAEHVAIASQHYRKLVQADLEDMDSLSPFAGTRYDAVVLADVLEHVIDRQAVLQRASRLLKPGGELLLSVPNVGYAGVVLDLLEGRFDYRDEGILDDTHVRFYTRDSLCEWLTGQGYSVVDIDTVTRPLHQTEFSHFSPELLPGSLVNHLLAREDALAYQYILCLRPDGEGRQVAYQPVTGIVNRFETRLFWMAGADLQHHQDKMLQRWTPLSEQIDELVFRIEDDSGIEVLRFSPADRTGVVHLHSFTVKALPDGPQVDTADAGLLATALCQNITVTQGDAGVSLFCEGGNPWFEIDLKQLFDDTPLRQLEVCVRQSWPMSQDYQALLARLDSDHQKLAGLADDLVEQRAHRRGLAGEIALLKETLQQREQALEDLERALFDVREAASRSITLRFSPRLVEFAVRARTRLVAELARLLPAYIPLNLSAITNGSRVEGSERLRMAGDSGHLYFPTPNSLRGKSVLFRIRYVSDSRLIGPKLYEVIAGELQEVAAPMYEHRRGDTIFGTLKIPDDMQGLVLAPSRLDCTLTVKSFRLRVLGPLSRLLEDHWHWAWYWQVFGPGWVWERLVEEARVLFENFPRIGKYRSYRDWWEKFGRTQQDELDRQRFEIARFKRTPLVSIVMPVYNTAPSLLESAVRSVLRQNYGHWELCIVDDCSTATATREVLQRFASMDQRIRVHFRSSNGHISVATNDAIDMAGGDYVAFMDHDDELAGDALFHIARALQADSPPALLYSDEDIVDLAGVAQRPHFKPDWNPDYLNSVNYFCHLVVMERELLTRLGGLRKGFEGAQDYDLVLRATAELKDSQIRHIPRVLYHWRAIEGSTADNIDNKDYAVDAGKRALEDHVKRRRLNATVELSELGMAYRLRYRLPDPPPSVDILMPTRDGVEVLSHCLRTLLERTAYDNYRVTVIDNGSRDPGCLEYLAEIEKHPQVRVLPYDREFNFAAIMNEAASQSDADILLLMNNDMEVINGDWLEEMVAQAMRKDIGAVGAKLFYASDYIQHAGVVLGLGPDAVAGHAFKGFYKHDTGHMGRLRLVQNYSAVTGACLAICREKYAKVGGMDENHFAIAFNDVDFCLRLVDAGYRNLWTPYAQLYHFESWSRGYDTGDKRARFERERDFMKQKWGDRLLRDPAYNPNLTRHFENFDFAWPPRGEH